MERYDGPVLVWRTDGTVVGEFQAHLRLLTLPRQVTWAGSLHRTGRREEPELALAFPDIGEHIRLRTAAGRVGEGRVFATIAVGRGSCEFDGAGDPPF